MKKRILSILLIVCLIAPTVSLLSNVMQANATVGDITTRVVDNLTSEQMEIVDRALEHSNTYVLTKLKRVGGSHFAYTEDLSEEIIYSYNLPEGGEAIIRSAPSRMVLLTIEKLSESSILITEEILIDLPNGVVRDPDVSADGKKVIFSQRRDKYEDFKIYEMTLADRSVKQLTFGDGVADFEPIYLPDGNIMFSSSRIIQTIDCWKVPVSNLYIMNPDGSNIRRIGYDQVHTTTPSLTSDGRVIYTRWDYNDRTQLFIQGLFQMMPDGTGQTELYGNNSNFPTALIHAREIPGESGKYMAVATGHHTTQLGKLVTVDVNIERNSNDAVNFVFPDEFSQKSSNVDQYGQVGPIYRYPYPIDSETFFISADLDGIVKDLSSFNPWSIPSGDAQFNLYLSDGSSTDNMVPISYFDNGYSPAQLVAVKTRTMFLRSSMVNYAQDRGTFYIGDVYAGEGMKGVKRGTAKRLRVVALKYRNYAIGATISKGSGNGDPFSPISTGNGAWDVKAVLGSVPIEEDGSVLFEAPSDMPLYFQVLDEEGCVIASMRSWTTLMPGESFSCIGCHENKDNVPPANATSTLALKKGVQKITLEEWQEDDVYEGYDPYKDEPIGFDYEDEVQKILDKDVALDYSNIANAMAAIDASKMTGLDTDSRPVAILQDDKWDVSFESQSGAWYAENFDSSNWRELYGPFGAHKNGLCEVNSIWESEEMYLRRTFTVDNYMISEYTPLFEVMSSGEYTVYLNGKLAFSGSASTEVVRNFFTNSMVSLLRKGENTIAIKVQKGSAEKPVFSLKMYSDTDTSMIPEGAITESYSETLIDKATGWKYTVASSDTLGTSVYEASYDDSSWSSGNAPFGNGTKRKYTTTWGEYRVSSYLWVRKHFTVTEEMLEKANFRMSAFFAQAPEFYVNGKKILNNTTSGSGGYYTNWGYRDIYLDEDFKNALKEGDNVISVRLTNPTNDYGGFFDLGLYADFSAYNEGFLVEARSDWNYIYSGTAPASSWTGISFNDSTWQTGEAPFGDMKAVGYNTNLTGTGKTLYARKHFNITNLAEYSNCGILIYALYDQDPKVYLNGNLILEKTSYNTEYTVFDLGTTISKYFVQGENVLSIEVPNSSGEIGADFALYAYDIDVGADSEGNIEKISSEIALSGKLMESSRMKKSFPLSYLVLTASLATSNVQWVGDSTNDYINWISSMSKPEMLKPYEFGSKTSTGLFELLEPYYLSDTELRTIRAWIDLGVPAYGEYDTNTNWTDKDLRDATEKDNKRAFYDMQDEQAKKKIAGVEKKAPISIEFSGNDGLKVSATDNESASVVVSRKYTAGDTFTITLPEGEKYLAFTFTPKVAESIIYVPSGVFTYTLPSYASKVFPVESFSLYTENVASARIPDESELLETRNLALNPFDTDTASGTYPHVSGSSNYASDACRPRAIIDGFEMNLIHNYSTNGLGYPVMSWGLYQGDASKESATIDFGRYVSVSSVGIKIRADFDHDDYFTSCTVELSDGTEHEFSMKKTSEMMWLTFEDPVLTSSLKIKNLKNTTTDRWPAITETRVMGREVVASDYEQCPVKVTKGTATDSEGATVNRASIGTIITLTADKAPAGMIFDKWVISGASVVDENSATTTFIMPACKVTATATYKEHIAYYTVAFDTGGGSDVESQTIRGGQKASKPREPVKAGYEFKGWTLNGSTYNFNAPVGEDLTIVAKWEKRQVGPENNVVFKWTPNSASNEWPTWQPMQGGNYITNNYAPVGYTARLSFEYVVVGDLLRTGNLSGQFNVGINGGASCDITVNEGSTSNSTKLLYGYPAKMDVTYTVTKAGSFQPIIGSLPSNTYTIYVWNVKLWMGDTEYTIDGMNRGETVTSADIPTIYKQSAGDLYLYSQELIDDGIQDDKCLSPRDGRLIRVTFEYYTERKNLSLLGDMWKIAGGRGTADIEGNFLVRDSYGAIYIQTHDLPLYIWDITLWYDKNKDNILSEDEKYPVYIRYSAGGYSMVSENQFEQQLGFAPNDELAMVASTDSISSTATGASFGFNSVPLTANQGDLIDISFKYFVAGDAYAKPVGVGGNGTITNKSSDYLKCGVVDEFSCTYSYPTTGNGCLFSIEIIELQTSKKVPTKIFIWDIKFKHHSTAVFSAGTYYEVDTIYTPYCTNGFTAEKVVIDENLFTCDADDAVLDGRLGDANWDGTVDVLDMVYANTKVSNKNVIIKDYRAVDFSKNGLVDKADFKAIREKILKAIS